MLKKIYAELLSEFGQQGWWPVSRTQNAEGGPKYGIVAVSEGQKLEICIGAILTQNTSWKNVEKAVINLNKNNLISIKKLKEINIKNLAELIKPSGYYNQKAIKIKNFIDFLIKNFNGNLENLFKLNKEDLREELLKIKGIGKETADSIILYAAHKPIFVIDAYTKRIFERILNSKFRDYDEWQNYFEKNLKRDGRLFNEYHALIVEFGKNVCKKEPLCEGCVLKKRCKYDKFI